MADLVYKTLGDTLDDTAAEFGDRDALVYVETGLRYNYKQFQAVVDEVAKGLMQLGIKKGEHVAIWATNVPEWVVAQFATAKIGAVLVTVNTSYRTHELEYLLRQSDSTTLILIDGFKGTSYVDTVYEICPELAAGEPGGLECKKLPKLKNVIYIGQEKRAGMYTWDDIVNMGGEASDEELQRRQQSLRYDEVINMQYTSGTTGFPKGVMLSHFNILNNAINVAECMGLSNKDKLCIPVPFFHCFGCVMGTLACVANGAAMVPTIEFNPKTVLKAIEQEGCTAVHGVPTMFIAELADPDFSAKDLSTLRTGIMAGAPCPEKVMKQVMEDMGCNEVTIAYGQTESSPVITQTRRTDSIQRRVSSVGRVLPNVEAKIVDQVTGEVLPPGIQGELCTRGYLVMKGYYNMPEETDNAIDDDGWLHTGDLATMDEDGYYTITGRLKDMIIRGGENIYPREIEEFLYINPKILDVQVLGVPDEKYGEQVLACIKKQEDVELSPKEVQEFCQGKIARHKIPYYVMIMDEYPMTASGKIQKFKLRKMAVEELGLADGKAVS
ncbi:AMP-binding protein [Metallumcola ferriviriculae]|uniref:AMP-binding protein n=1 Tax=Metallumcola ferriviriculae TaxID=3039180 RepID=A0AAU0UNR6_9FIRM|nr:AMP-binding protein [Desulfitibacteraceae bacterium MK1]